MSCLQIVAGTGRMATSAIAEALNKIPGVGALHEGHLGDDDGVDVLPMINVKHFLAYRDEFAAAEIVRELRSEEIVKESLKSIGQEQLIDVAYYNGILAQPLLEANQEMKMVAIIRDCESFVRSATWLTGTDPMPVGWPDTGKPLNSREKFIAMGRLRPISGEAKSKWSSWSAIQKNIWLWEETNTRLISAVSQFRTRSLLINFDDFISNTSKLFDVIAKWLVPVQFERSRLENSWTNEKKTEFSRRNARIGGYQVRESIHWTTEEQLQLKMAVNNIKELVEVAGGYDSTTSN